MLIFKLYISLKAVSTVNPIYN